MIFMSNKLLIIILVALSNCSIVSYSEVIPLAKLAIIGADDIEITEEFINSKQFSFAKVKIGRSAIAIFSLIKIDENGSFEWISGEGEMLTTYNGKIIKLQNSIYNMEFINFSNFKPFLSKESNLLNYDLILLNPMAFVTQEAVLSSQQHNQNTKFYESVVTEGFKWDFENEYLYNSNGRIIYTRQLIHPKVPEIEIDFYYK
jgi:Protein of unknown function (DUF2886).